MRHALLALCFAIMLGSLAYALSGATATTAAATRWTGGTAGSSITEGGNITAVNVNSISLTDKWAAYFGNVSGTINLTTGTATIYSWTWTATSGGEVCVSTSSSLPAGAPSATTGAAINSLWGFGSAADNATNTFATANCNMNLSTGAVSNTANVTHKGSSTYQTCAVLIGGAAKANAFFCTAINTTGTAFNNQSANYELMVPTNSTAATTETYYFYAELN